MAMQGWRTSALFRRYAIVDGTDMLKALEAVDPPPHKA
jgi:hypothetical protein